MRRCALLLMFPLMSLLSATTLAQDIVERRGGLDAVTGEIVVLTGAGVSIRTEAGDSRVISWDRVRDVHSAKHDASWKMYEAFAEDAWRARSRVERGDYALAEALLERLFEQSRGQAGESALVIAEGLLRCRLSRGAHEDAMLAALEVIRLRRAGITTESYSMLPAVFDSEFELCPKLAPVFISSTGSSKLQRELAAYDAGGDAVVRTIARLYLAAVDADASIPPVLTDDGPEHRGVAWLRLLVEPLRPQDRNERVAAVERIDLAEDQLPDWAQAWGHYVRGAALVADTEDLNQQYRGVLELLRLPAGYMNEQPYLAAAAMHHAAAALDRLGDLDGAENLRDELNRRFPRLRQLRQMAHAPNNTMHCERSLAKGNT